MREIQFQVVIEKDGKIEKYSCGVFNNEVIISTNIPYVGQTFVKLTSKYGKLIGLRQYTGLKEKKGKEIYEGDIVKVSYESNRLSIDDFEIIGEVIWSPEYLQFLVRTNIKHLKDGSVEFELYELCDTEYYSVLEIEIIGNIYEHPLLLEENK